MTTIDIKPWEIRDGAYGTVEVRTRQADPQQIWHLAKYIGHRAAPSCNTGSRTGWMMTADPLAVSCTRCLTDAQYRWDMLWVRPPWKLDRYQRHFLSWSLTFPAGLIRNENEAGWPKGLWHTGEAE